MRKYLTVSETKKLFTIISDKRDNLLFKLCYLYGMRISEALGLSLDSFDLVGGKISIKALKGGQYSVSPLRPDLLIEVKNFINKYRIQTDSNYLFATKWSDKMSRVTAFYLFKGYTTKAGISPDKRHPHSLRHSTVVHMAEAGVGVWEVKEFVRHKSINSTQIYFDQTSKTKLDNQTKSLKLMAI